MDAWIIFKTWPRDNGVVGNEPLQDCLISLLVRWHGCMGDQPV